MSDAAATRDTVLRVEHLSKAFDGVRAVDDVSFSVAAGEILALMGPNGAGKSTCFNLINGQLVPDRGEIRLAGERIDGLPPRSIARRRVARTFQTAATFASMSVRENVQLALIAHADKQWSMRARADHQFNAQADALLAQFSIAALAGRACGTLAYGDLKRVEIAIALSTTPRLLLMDEPTAGTAPAERDTMMRDVVAMVRAQGIATVFTEHDVDVVFAHADRIIVLDYGRIIADGPPAAIRADNRVREVYLGVDAR